MFKRIKSGESLKAQWHKAKKAGYKGLSIDAEIQMDKNFHTIASTARMDRDNEIVVQNFELENFKSNPVVVDSHNYSTIENIVGRFLNVEQTDKGLEGDIDFAEESPKGKLAKKLAEGGYLRAVSIGFIPLEFAEGERGIITRSELLELSVCVVQSNADALIQNNKNVFSKEGQVLSSANKKDIEQAIEYLNKVLKRSQKEDKSQDEPEEPKDEPKDDPKDEPKDEPEKKNPEDELKKATEKIKQERERKLNLIAKELGETHENNLDIKRRKMFKALRQIKSQDKEQ